MPRFILQRVQEVVVQAESYPGAVQALRELESIGYWERRKAATFVLPGQVYNRPAEFIRLRAGLMEVRNHEKTGPHT